MVHYSQSLSSHIFSRSLVFGFETDIPEEKYKLICIQLLFLLLPTTNRNIFEYLLILLLEVAKHTECQMDLKSFSKILAPTLMGTKDSHATLQDFQKMSLILEFIFSNPDAIFCLRNNNAFELVCKQIS